MKNFPKVVAIAGGISLIATGLYAFLAPQSFFDTLATFPPYNEHFIHDIGAFQIGIGAMLVLVAIAADGLGAVLVGAATGQTAHLIAHVLDRDRGENQGTTIPLLTFM